MQPGAQAFRKLERQRLVASLVERKRLGTQLELIQALAAAGCRVTQATVSRDVRELGIIKTPDPLGRTRYSLPSRARRVDPRELLETLLGQFGRSAVAAQNVVVVQCEIGSAPAIAGRSTGSPIPSSWHPGGRRHLPRHLDRRAPGARAGLRAGRLPAVAAGPTAGPSRVARQGGSARPRRRGARSAGSRRGALGHVEGDRDRGLAVTFANGVNGVNSAPRANWSTDRRARTPSRSGPAARECGVRTAS